jgi:signal peptidase I
VQVSVSGAAWPGTGVAYVKRVIGLPGDVVVYDRSSKRLTINGKAANVQPLGAYTGNPGADLVREAIGDRSHLQLLMRGRLSAGGTYTVPDGHFVLGDHRDNSRDSRFSGFEFIPVESIVGKVALVWWNTDDSKRAGIVPE